MSLKMLFVHQDGKMMSRSKRNKTAFITFCFLWRKHWR